ncbi:MAG TPA: OsmC family protein [Solirubrobacteraceae bacterium]|nr:OsmC family protein [Solirubrobacteraceae bacterium]
MIKATARRADSDSFRHEIEFGRHRITVDEPTEVGGGDEGPSPQQLLAASLAACTAITIEMYAKRKEWDIGAVEADCEYEKPEQGSPTKFKLTVRLSDQLSQEQVERLGTIAAKCPVHRVLAGEVMFEERIELVAAAP